MARAQLAVSQAQAFALLMAWMLTVLASSTAVLWAAVP
jgi:hypothetical protein